MKKGFETWSEAVKSAYPSAFSPYWHAMPLRRMTKLLAAWFVALCGAGWLADLVQIRAHPLAYGFFWPVLLGVVGTAVFTAEIHRPRWVLPLYLLISIGIFLGCLAVRGSPTLPVPAPIFRRVLVDTLVAWTGMASRSRAWRWAAT